MENTQKLLGFDLTATPDGGVALTVRSVDLSEDAPRPIYQTVLAVEPFVADALRHAVLREIPAKPHTPLSHDEVMDLVKGRMVQLEVDLFG